MSVPSILLRKLISTIKDVLNTNFAAFHVVVSVPSILLRKLISTIIVGKDVLNMNFAAFHVVNRWFLYTIMIIKGFIFPVQVFLLPKRTLRDGY